MDIEERADNYARDNTPIQLAGIDLFTKEIDALRALLATAYLAGSAQTQADYSADTRERRAVTEGWPPT